MKPAVTIIILTLTALLLAPLAARCTPQNPTSLKHTGQVIELVGDRDALGVADKPGMRRSAPGAGPPLCSMTGIGSSFTTSIPQPT